MDRTLPELAIGWADEMSAEELSGKFITSGAVYNTAEDELNSADPNTGLLPSDPAIMGDNYALIQKSALARGVDEQLAIVEDVAAPEELKIEAQASIEKAQEEILFLEEIIATGDIPEGVVVE